MTKVTIDASANTNFITAISVYKMRFLYAKTLENLV